MSTTCIYYNRLSLYGDESLARNHYVCVNADLGMLVCVCTSLCLCLTVTLRLAIYNYTGRKKSCTIVSHADLIGMLIGIQCVYICTIKAYILVHACLQFVSTIM